jgi:hypothetical protein
VVWAFLDDPFLGGELGFGWTQALLLGCGLALLTSCVLKREWAGLVLTAFLSCFMALACAEVALRLVLGPSYYARFQLDDKYLYKLIPGSTRDFHHTSANGGGTVRYYVNDQGFRGPALQARVDEARVVVYGDSFIQAEFSELEGTFPHRLAVDLEGQLGYAVEAVNAGVAGYGPDQALLKMQDELPWLKPDLVVFSVYSGNDFGDLVRNKLFRMGRHGFEANVPSPELDPVLRRNMEISPYDSILKKIAKQAATALRGESSDTPSGWSERLTLLKAEYEEYVLNGDNVVTALLTDDYTSDLAFLPESAQARYKVDLMTGVLIEVKELAASLQVPVVVLIIPHPIDVSGGNHVTGRVDRSVYTEYEPAYLSATVERIANELGLANVNLFEAFQRHGVDGIFLNGLDDHWNDEGQGLAASVVAQYVIDQGLVARPNTPDQ